MTLPGHDTEHGSSHPKRKSGTRLGRFVVVAVAFLVPVVATAQAPDSLGKAQPRIARRDSTGYDLAMGVHIGEPAGWSIALGVERDHHETMVGTSFLLLEPGRRSGRVSLGMGSETGTDLATAMATNVRASYLRVWKPSTRAPIGNYGGVEGQVLFLGLGARLGVFSAGVGRKPITMIDLSFGF